MSQANWVAIAQVVSTLAAVVAVCVAAWQMRRASLANDLQALQKFFEISNGHEAALAKADDEAARSHVFVELLNFLEINSCAYNNGLFGRGCRKLVRHKIEDTYIELDQSPAWHSRIAKAIDRSTTFEELTKFLNKHVHEIMRRAAERERHAEHKCGEEIP